TAALTGLDLKAPAQLRLVVDDSADPTPRSATLSPTGLTGLLPLPVTFADAPLSSVWLKTGPGGNTLDVTGTGPGPTTLDTGTGGDQVRVAATTGTLVINDGGPDHVTVGTAAGILSGVQGTVLLHNSSHRASLVLDGHGATVSQHGQLQWGPGRTSLINGQDNGSIPYLPEAENSDPAREFLPGSVNFDPDSLASLTVRGGIG